MGHNGEEEVHRETTGESLDEQQVLVLYSSKAWTPTLTSLILHIGLIHRYTQVYGGAGLGQRVNR